MASNGTDFLSAGGGGTPLAWQLMGQVPQYRLNETAPNLRQDSAIASTRSLQDYTQRTLPDMANASAAQGNFGSSGFQNRMQRATTDYGRGQDDVSRMLYRNLASIAKNKIMATTGGMF